MQLHRNTSLLQSGLFPIFALTFQLMCAKLGLVSRKIWYFYMKNKLTISDIAKAAGVSKTTVSFVLNDKEGISKETRQKVLDVIKETNYRPAMNSRRLYFQKTFTIAVMYDNDTYRIDNLFYLDIMNALLKRCTSYDYSLVYSEYSCTSSEITLPDNVLNKDVDGLIFLKDIPLALISTLDSLDIPFVVADAHSEYDSLYTVKVDYRLAAYDAVKYLIRQGHRHIGFIGNMQLTAFYAQVFSGYQKALREYDLPLELNWCFEKVHSRETTEQFVGQLLKEKELPTAIFCMEDVLAIELIRFLQKHAISVPDDISVISIDDIVLSNMIYPSLTTIAVDKEQIGSSAIDILMDLINSRATSSTIVTANKIVERESVRSLV